MIGLPNPYLAGAVAIGLTFSHGYAYFKGRGGGSASVAAKYAKASAKALAAMRRGEKAIDQINGRYAAVASRQQSENWSIRNAAQPLILRPEYGRLCLPADGVQLLDRARANANLSLDPGEPASVTPGATGNATRR